MDEYLAHRISAVGVRGALVIQQRFELFDTLDGILLIVDAAHLEQTIFVFLNVVGCDSHKLISVVFNMLLAKAKLEAWNAAEHRGECEECANKQNV